ncbi:MAG: sigma-70 family RNA polymerase sigma factor [Planctomycetes bacterium]|jgi:RNA polymerase primary sigma factor|nr:sigma-70 family RNA polymerase sigma factor [Planctomycetota bacterium]
MSTALKRTPLGWYLDQIKSTPLLTAEEEQQLGRRVREHSDPVAREQMIQSNLRLVVKIAKEYSSPGMTLADLVAEGNIGLVRAVEAYDPDAGVRFSTYAAWWIKQAIKRALINTGQPIRVPAYLAKLINRWRRATRQMEVELGRPPEVEEVASRLHISRQKAEIIQQGMTAANAPTQIGSDEAQAAAEMLADLDTDGPDQRMLDASTGTIIRSLLDRVDERSQQILVLRYGLDGHDGIRTYKEIGDIIGLTRERVRQLERQALAQLRSVLDKQW